MAKGNFKKGNNPKGKLNKKAGFKKKFIKSKTFKRKALPFDVEARLVVRNLSFKTTNENLQQHFEPYGKILEINLLKRPSGDLVGCGFVQYENVDDAKHGFNSRNGQPFLGRSIQIEWALPKGEFLKNRKPANGDDNNDGNDEIKSEPETDNVESEIVPKKKADKSKKQSKLQNDRFKNNTEEEKQPKNKIVRKARLIVRNIPFKATDETFKKHFEPYGEVTEVVILKKPNGDLVGCGFVQYQSIQAATKAILETNAKPFLGRPIHVDWAVAKNKYMSYVTQKQDEEEYTKNEVKSEPESDEDEEIKLEKSDDIEIKDDPTRDSDEDGTDDNSSKDNESEDDEDMSDDDKSVQDNIDKEPEDLRVSAHDAEDGRTVFFKNVPFSVTSEDLEVFVKEFGEINYALVCMDKLTEHSKGTAFVRFKNKEDADICFSSGPERMLLHGQSLEPLPALFRDRAKGKNESARKHPKDARNLYLIKEGLVMANSKAAMGVSTTDMGKRLALEQKKSQMLRNLNRFISRYRLTIHNIPPHFTDEDFKGICLQMANVKPYALKECRLMRDLNGPLDANGKYMTKGYGFVMFTKHEDALTCLRRMNNNPSLFDKNNRPIVAFSIEDKAILNARKKRLEKSKIRNPLHKNYREESNNEQPANFRNKNKFGKPMKNNNNKNPQNKDNTNTDSPKLSNKQKKANKRLLKSTANTNDPPSMNEEYIGEMGKPGDTTKMRSRYKLKLQANMHKDNVKQERKKQKTANKNKFLNVREKVKQPKQKMNTGERKKMKKIAEHQNDKNFTDLVNKYKSKLVGTTQKIEVKSKWFEQS